MISTIGAKPACLVNASVTYVGDDQIYAFGGFDQYTDEGMYTVLDMLIGASGCMRDVEKFEISACQEGGEWALWAVTRQPSFDVVCAVLNFCMGVRLFDERVHAKGMSVC